MHPKTTTTSLKLISKILPKKVKEKRKKASADTRIVDGREKVNQVFKMYSASPNFARKLQ